MRIKKLNELMSLYNSLEEKQTKKEEEAERLVGAVVNKVGGVLHREEFVN